MSNECENCKFLDQAKFCDECSNCRRYYCDKFEEEVKEIREIKKDRGTCMNSFDFNEIGETVNLLVVAVNKLMRDRK